MTIDNFKELVKIAIPSTLLLKKNIVGNEVFPQIEFRGPNQLQRRVVGEKMVDSLAAPEEIAAPPGVS